MEIKSPHFLKLIFFFGLLLSCLFTLTSCKLWNKSQTWSPLSTPSKDEQNKIDCFIEIALIPGETSKEQVLQLWGKPSNIDAPESDFWWSYQTVWRPSIFFDGEKVQDISLYLKKCTLDDVIQAFGPPDIVEFKTAISCIGAPPFYNTKFHYPKLGIAFEIICGSGLSKEECKLYKPNDQITIKDFYKNGKEIKDSTGFNMHSETFPWPGFSQSNKK